MYRDRGGGGGSSRSEFVAGPLDRKRINDALDKHLEKSSPSTSRGGLNSKDKEKRSVPSTSTGKSQQLDPRDSRSTSLSKNKCSEGQPFFVFVSPPYWSGQCFYYGSEFVSAVLVCVM